MSVTVLLELHAKPGSGKALKEVFRQILPDTRRFDGCRSVTVLGNEDEEGQLVLVEQWGAREHHENYMEWRTERGDIAKLGELLAAPPSIRYFDEVDA